MPRTPSSRKYQLTINNPTDHGFTHPRIKVLLEEFSSLRYWCMCDEVGEEGTLHTHLYIVFENAVMFTTLHSRFYGAHIEAAKGSNQENRDYIRKEGKYQESEKKRTNLQDTFEEWGELPPDRTKGQKDTEAIYQLIKDGASDIEIMETFPTAMNRLDKISKARETLLAEKYKDTFRDLTVEYIFGDTGVGKTRGIMEQYGYTGVYRVTNYTHPFDGYKGQDVIIFEEFRSNLPIGEMLTYLEGYPLYLPSRYNDKVACFTKVYLISNIPIEQQYQNIQYEQPVTWQAFYRRINEVKRVTSNGTKTLAPVVAWSDDEF